MDECLTRPISLRLDAHVRAILEEQVKREGISLVAYLRLLAANKATALRRAQIHEESRRVGERVEGDRDASTFYAEVGSGTATI